MSAVLIMSKKTSNDVILCRTLFKQHLQSRYIIKVSDANWPMKCEAKMATQGGQFCTSVSFSYAGLQVTFSLPREFYFCESFLCSKWTQNMSLKDRNELKNFKNISTKSCQVTSYIFTKMNYQIDEKPDKTASTSYLRKLLCARPFLLPVYHL